MNASEAGLSIQLNLGYQQRQPCEYAEQRWGEEGRRQVEGMTNGE
jgi:hypothetical protein